MRWVAFWQESWYTVKLYMCSNILTAQIFFCEAETISKQRARIFMGNIMIWREDIDWLSITRCTFCLISNQTRNHKTWSLNLMGSRCIVICKYKRTKNCLLKAVVVVKKTNYYQQVKYMNDCQCSRNTQFNSVGPIHSWLVKRIIIFLSSAFYNIIFFIKNIFKSYFYLRSSISAYLTIMTSNNTCKIWEWLEYP